MTTTVLLNINFLENTSARPKILSKRSWFFIGLAGIMLCSIIFSALSDQPIQGFYAKAVSPANGRTSQNPLDHQPVKSALSLAASAPARLPTNGLIRQKQINRKSAAPIQNAVSSKPTASAAGQAESGLPIRLKIPKINVDAAVEYVGLTPQGIMGAPKGPPNVAWFNLGPRPGDNGSAVIAGHYGRWKNGQESVFNDLSKLAPGDKIYVKDNKGTTITFTVRASRRYDSKAEASEVFNLNDGKPHLNLIACEGVWNKVTKNYSQRLVIFAEKTDSMTRSDLVKASSL